MDNSVIELTMSDYSDGEENLSSEFPDRKVGIAGSDNSQIPWSEIQAMYSRLQLAWLRSLAIIRFKTAPPSRYSDSLLVDIFTTCVLTFSVGGKYAAVILTALFTDACKYNRTEQEFNGCAGRGRPFNASKCMPVRT